MESIAGPWGATLAASELTPAGLGRHLAGPCSAALRANAPAIRAAAGSLAWAAAWPAWRVLTTRAVLAVLLRVAIEVLLVAFVFPHAALVRAAAAVLLAILGAPAGAPLASAPGGGDALAELFRALEAYRRDPRTREYVLRLETLLTDRAQVRPETVGALARPRGPADHAGGY